MQFLIHTKGNALNVCDKSYVVDAPSESEAKEMAVSSFESEFGAFADSITTQLFKRTNKSIMAYICMLIPILLSLISWNNGHDTYSISPSLVSCIYSVAFYAAFIVRFKGIHRTVGSWIDIVFSVLIILLISTFIQLILVKKTINLFWIAKFTVDAKSIILIAIILSWFGFKLISAICIAGVGILALFNITALSSAMGMIWGPVYVISSFMGIMLYLSVEPVMLETVSLSKKSTMQSINYVKNDFIQAKSSVKNLNRFSQKEDSEQLQKSKQEVLNK